MQKVDRMLMAILAGVVGLVLIAFAILLTRPKPSYLPDNTPGAAVHNYLLALQLADDSRAYSYVSPTLSGYPKNLDAFQRSIQTERYVFDGLKTATFDVGEGAAAGNTASVSVAQHNVDSGGIFGSSGNPTTVIFRLQRNTQTGAWQIVHADDFWPYCWEYAQSC